MAVLEIRSATGLSRTGLRTTGRHARRTGFLAWLVAALEANLERSHTRRELAKAAESTEVGRETGARC